MPRDSDSRFGPFHQVHDYGGGSSGGTTAGRYFYLIVKSSQKEHALEPDDVQKFFRSGVNTNEDYAFTLVDIASDHRLKEDLLKIANGADFYDKLDASAPAFLITNAPIPRIFGAGAIKMFPVRDYDTDVNAIYNEMGLQPLNARQSTANFLRKVNSYLHLKPNMLGLGVNFNEMIADWIARLERNAP